MGATVVAEVDHKGTLCLDGWAEGAHAMIAGKRLIR